MATKINSSYILWAAKGALGILVLIYLYIKANAGGDFTIFLAAADAIYHHINCYHTLFTYQGVKMWNTYSYPPTFALLLSPFSQLPMVISEFAFLLSYPFLIWRIFKLTEMQLPIVDFSISEKRLWLLLIGIYPHY